MDRAVRGASDLPCKFDYLTSYMETEPPTQIVPYETAEEAATFFADAFRKFITLRGIIHFPNHLVDPSAFVLRPRSPQALFLSFLLPLAEHYPQLVANRINVFLKDLIGLAAWQQILPEYDALARYYLKHEFVHPLLQHALREPPAIKNQVVYSLTRLATVLEASNNTFEIPAENEIDLSTLRVWVSHWPGYKSLEKRLSGLNTRSFRNGTRNFRDRDAHTLAPDLHGIVPAPKVRRDSRGVETTWAYEPALETETLLDTLTEQHRAAVELLDEMRTFIKARLQDHIV